VGEQKQTAFAGNYPQLHELNGNINLRGFVIVVSGV
jgi:hypothetical protein